MDTLFEETTSKHCKCHTYRYFCYCDGEDNLLEKIKNGDSIIRHEIYNDNENNICSYAALCGHLKILKWLRSQKPPYGYNIYTCAYAAKNGHLEVLKWLRSQNPPCKWNHQTMHYAAENGQLDVIKWILEQHSPCKWSAYTTECAAKNGHLEVIKWMLSQPKPCGIDVNSYYLAGINGHINVLKYLIGKNKCLLNRLIVHAGRNGHLSVFKLYINELEYSYYTFNNDFEIETHCSKYLFEINYRSITNTKYLKEIEHFKMIIEF